MLILGSKRDMTQTLLSTPLLSGKEDVHVKHTLAECDACNDGIISKVQEVALTLEGLTLLGKLERTLFIECFIKQGMSEQVCQQFLGSQGQEGGSSREGRVWEATEA